MHNYRYHVAAATTAEFAVEALRFTILIFVVSGEIRHGRVECRQCTTQQASGIGRDGGPARAQRHAAADDAGLAERIMRAKTVPTDDDRSRELIQKTVLGSLNRAKETIARVEVAGVVS
jgi:hypothetical protein